MTIQSTSFTRPRTGFVLAASGTGLKVSASSGMTVSIAAGVFWLGNATTVYAGGNVTLGTADATNNRYDTIAIDVSGSIVVTKGTPAASPAVPTTREDVLLLAVITVTAADATIAPGDIVDLRDFGGLSADGTTISVSSSGVLSVVPGGLTGFPSTMYSATGSTNITGDGTAQTVFTKTFAAGDWAVGDMMRITLRLQPDRTAGADTPDLVLSVGATTIWSEVSAADATNYIIISNVFDNGTSVGSGFITQERIIGGATTVTDSTSPQGVFGTSFAFKLTIDPAISTNETVYYTILVEKVKTGVA